MIGLGESLVEPAALATDSWRISAIVSPTLVAAAQSVTTRATWLELDRRPFARLPQAQTLCAVVRQGTPAAGSLRVKWRGRGSLGEHAQEVSPVVGIPAKSVVYVHLALVSTWVDEVSYQGDFSAGATLEVGVVNDLRRENTLTVEHVAPENLGWGTRWNSPMVPSSLLGLDVVDVLRSERWVVREPGLRFGYAEPGWQANSNKLGVVWDQIVGLTNGGAPAYNPGDLVVLSPLVRHQDG